MIKRSFDTNTRIPLTVRNISLNLIVLNADFLVFLVLGCDELPVVQPEPLTSCCRTQAPPSVASQLYSHRQRLPDVPSHPNRTAGTWAQC